MVWCKDFMINLRLLIKEDFITSVKSKFEDNIEDIFKDMIWGYVSTIH
jgi:hypothetical protein